MSLFIRAGAINLDAGVDTAALPQHLAGGLLSVDARDVQVCGDRVAFRPGLFRLVNNWNVLLPFESGFLTIDRQARQVFYELRYRQLIIVVTAMTSFVAIPILFSSARAAALFAPVMWLWLVGGNLLIGFGRFESFVGRLLSSAPKMLHSEGAVNRVRS